MKDNWLTRTRNHAAVLSFRAGLLAILLGGAVPITIGQELFAPNVDFPAPILFLLCFWGLAFPFAPIAAVIAIAAGWVALGQVRGSAQAGRDFAVIGLICGLLIFILELLLVLGSMQPFYILPYFG